MAVFTCPKCGHSQVVDDKHIGKNASCPRCKMQAAVVADGSEGAVPETAFVETDSRRLIHAVAGPLGIRCDYWFETEKHINTSAFLKVEAWTIIDDTLPLRFSGPCGLLVHNRSRDYPFELFYQGAGILLCTEEHITAFETRHMTFNVWGEHVVTLTCARVTDIEVGKQIRIEPRWQFYSEHEANEFCGCLSFVARVRVASGEVKRADMTYILREAQRIVERVTASDLEPKPPKKE
jgi:hypothetical protein